MFCPNCGANLPRDSRFCSECGEAVAAPAPARPKLLQQLQQLPPLYKKLILGFVVLFLVGTISSVLSVMIKPTVNLNRYLVPEFTGYNEYGHANIHIDMEKFVKDHGERLTDYVGTGDEYAAAEYFLQAVVSGHPSKDVRLTNGDTLMYLWQCDDKTALKQFGCKLKYKTKNYTVKGLEDPTEFDPFAGVELSYEGISPYGNAEITGTPSHAAAEDLRFDLDKSWDLAEGDKVTMTFNICGYYYDEEEDIITYLADNYGLIPNAMTKEFTVNGMNRYMSDVTELSSTALSDMHKRAEEIFVNNYFYTDGETAAYQSMTYCGSYLISKRDGDDSWFSNELYAVYEVQIQHDYTRKNNTFSELSKFYWCVNFDEILTNSKGITTMNMDYYDVPYNNYVIDSGISSGWYNKTWEYRGFGTLDDLYNKVIADYAENYKITSSVTAPAN